MLDTIAYLAKSGEGRGLSVLRHSCDALAVAEILTRHALPSLDGAGRMAVALLIGCHDLGKFSASFQAAIRHGEAQAEPHWHLTSLMLEQCDDLFEQVLTGCGDRRRKLFEIIGGHHGQPLEENDRRAIRRRMRMIRPGDIAASRACASALLAGMSGARLDIGAMSEEQFMVFGWKLAGLAVQADWIASNEEWFPFERDEPGAGHELSKSRGRAALAIAAAGLHQALPRPGAKILPSGAAPTPMQLAAGEAPLPDGPAMFLIEESTGGGKTEAGLVLAWRLMMAGRADGIFLGLPTMATSNAMMGRIIEAAPRIFSGMPTVGLAHGRARHDDRFTALQGQERTDGSASCTAWIADGRRKVLFADIGVGTIDQAMMAVLPTRYNALRLHALSRKVLVIDEAHAYDPYMEETLCTLLTYQARLGGSAVIISASLPLEKRRKMIAAWQAGRGTASVMTQSTAYPALTAVGAAMVIHPVEAASWTRRRVPVRRIASVTEAVSRIVKASRKGAACIWIRNSVADAAAARELLAHAGIEAELLHSRFALCDRLSRESELLERFGKAGTGRRGRVVIATQVAEQSLDVDFDMMVSDLCPIECLIQRIGRLWRHVRENRPLAQPEIFLLSPEPGEQAGENWLSEIMPSGRHVYPLDVMWRTAHAVLGAGEIVAPEGLRPLIEAVHGAGAPAVPASLGRAERKSEQAVLAMRARAAQAAISPVGDYSAMTLRGLFDEERIQTRLGQLQETLVLARREGGRLVPWSGETGARGWALSEVQVPAHAYARLAGVDQGTAEINLAKNGWTRWQKEGHILAPVEDDGTICDGLSYDVTLGLVRGI